MNKTGLILLISLVFIPCGVVAFTNEPNGFRDMVWRESLNNLDDIAVFKEDKDFKYGYRKDDDYKWEAIDLDKIVYCFYRDEFFAGYIQTKGFANAELIRRNLVNIYGVRSGSNRKFNLYWEGKISKIVYKFDPVSELCQVIFISQEVLNHIVDVNKNWPSEKSRL